MGVVDFWLVWDWRGRLGAFGGGPRGATKNGNCNTLLSAKGREGPRRTATATPFYPRRAAKDREERQRQHPFVHEGPLRATKNGNGNTFLSTKGREGPRRAAKGHEGPRRTTKNGNGNTLLSTKGREGPRRTATATPFCPRRAAKGREERQRQHLFVHEGPRRAAKNGNSNTFLSTMGREGPRRTATATPFCPRRAAKGHEGPRRKP